MRDSARSVSQTIDRSAVLNRQSTPQDTSERSSRADALPRDDLEESRRSQLIGVTIDSLAELGYVSSTLAQIAGRAGVSPGLVAHYFGDKDGLLEAAFRSLASRVGDQVRARLARASTPRGRIQAVIDANLAPAEFDQRTGTAWLAFWGQVVHAPRLKRVQRVYQRRALSNLQDALKRLLPPEEARSLAYMIAAMIDGVWLRAALSEWTEADSESARALLTAFVDGRLQASASVDTAAVSAESVAGGPESGRDAATFASTNPATGEVLAQIRIDGVAEVDAAVTRAQAAQARWAATSGAERGRVLR